MILRMIRNLPQPKRMVDTVLSVCTSLTFFTMWVTWTQKGEIAYVFLSARFAYGTTERITMKFGVEVYTKMYYVNLILFSTGSNWASSSSSSSSLHGLGESPVSASSIVVSLSIVFLVCLCLVFRMVDIYLPVVDVISIYWASSYKNVYNAQISDLVREYTIYLKYSLICRNQYLKKVTKARVIICSVMCPLWLASQH
jgi:hypothetical protein